VERISHRIVEESLKSIGEKAMKDRDSYQGEMEAKLRELGAKLDEMKAKADKAGVGARAEMEHQVDSSNAGRSEGILY
jgi:hypothetical protein